MGTSPTEPDGSVEAELAEFAGFDSSDLAPWDGRRVPVVLLGGYLGAGKTTLINEVLAGADRPVAVLVNDVGDVNIDARLIRRHRGGTIELTGGCVCCSLKNGLLAAFDELRQRVVPPELVVLELSGVADPKQTVGLVGTPGFMLDSIVVLVDLLEALGQLEEQSVRGDAVRAQIAAADMLVLTKADLVDEVTIQQVRAALAAREPDTPIVTAESIAGAAGLVGLATRRTVGDVAARPTLFDQHQSTVVPLPNPVSRGELDRIVAALPAAVVRAKGVARLDSGELVVIQGVGARRTIETLSKAEDQTPTDLVTIAVP